MSLLTGYAFATAIIGGAVFVDRVLYGGPDEQRLALGALAGATAVGALAVGLPRPAGWLPGGDPGRARPEPSSGCWRWPAGRRTRTSTAVAGGLALFGLGFGLSVTPRSAAAVEAAGRAGVRRRVVGRDRRPDDRDGGRPGHPYRVWLDDHRPTVGSRSTPRPTPISSSSPRSSATGRCATRSSSRRSRRGRRARRPRSWSGCSSWPPS